ncbi:biotin-dependent carboxyltransferase family protein [Luteipulveratus sp. YIM 133132]|uniref:5-oxoprolinase subunit C family protein n=1 Tax=Luteipulveratus flavus TaxID=3031728 RepID=UPI0023AE91B3|nr:biotin-dependent carboxyltransferase family protein [Luteipulveratus sp. YIM 133132]MDE9365285.1 biotin-dependent carboxyltransferase family protein [Luteipulveratus sp. YIM 133132]
MSELVVRRTGPLALVQDRGRPGLARLGVGTGGAADRPSYELAGRLVGNEGGAAGLELLLGGAALEAAGEVVLAVTGAPACVTVDGRAAPLCAPLRVASGSRVEIGTPVAGLRTYVAVRGGLRTRTVLGSRSVAPSGGLGLHPLAEGDRLPVGRSDAPVGEPGGSPVGPPLGPVDLPATIGPRDDWLTEDALAVLGDAVWQVGAEADRVGVRLTGPPLSRARAEELASEGIVRGAVQVPPSGQPLIFLADHPTTGGYPVVAVVDDAATDRLAQLRPGEQVRFVLRRASWLG